MVNVAPSVLRVMNYLDVRLHLERGGNTIHTLWGPDGHHELTVDDLIDLVRRSVLLESMSAEIDRLGAELARLRARLPDEPGIIEAP